MTFGELLQKYRERKGLSKVALANVIEKTDAYLRKIELNGYTPPVFSLCLKLASALELNDKERRRFMQKAFEERLNSDKEFYDYISDSDQDLAGDSDLDYKKPTESQSDFSIARCSYYICVYTRSKKKLLSNQIQLELSVLVNELIEKFGFSLQDLNCSKSKMECLIDVSADLNIQEFVEGLKNQLSSEIKSRYNDLADYPSIWNHDSLIHTVGSCPTKKEQSAYKKALA